MLRTDAPLAGGMGSAGPWSVDHVSVNGGIVKLVSVFVDSVLVAVSKAVDTWLSRHN